MITRAGQTWLLSTRVMMRWNLDRETFLRAHLLLGFIDLFLLLLRQLQQLGLVRSLNRL